MQQTLLTQKESSDIGSFNSSKGYATTFRQCLKSSEGKGYYHRKVFILIIFSTVFASIFMSLPFFLFKKPIYCESIEQEECCLEGDDECVADICYRYSNSIKDHVIRSQSLTYKFELFCNKDWLRVTYKLFPETLCLIGFLIYGSLSDLKGRKTSMKIAWRMYTVGVIIFSMTQQHFLKIFGYALASLHCFPALIIQFTLLFQINTKKQQNRESLLLLACISIGPVALSFASGLIDDIDDRIILAVLCSLPAFILSVLIDKIFQSPVCIYPFDKQKAFGIVNLIAKQNEKLPIMIDLSRSIWHKYTVCKTDLISLLKNRNINTKMLIGLFFLFMISFNIKISQISLDDYTETNLRSLLANIPTVMADVTLCIFLPKFKKRTSKYLLLSVIILTIAQLACRQKIDFDQLKNITIVFSVVTRYLTEFCDGLMLIWAIQTFPTICRGYAVGFVFCGNFFGVVLAYLLKEQMQIAYIVSLIITTLCVFSQGFLQLSNFGVMKDTLSNGYYDEYDCYYRS